MQAVVISYKRLPLAFLGCYGQMSIKTPNFDQLAAESILFDQHYSENLDPQAANHAWWTGKYQFPLDDQRQAASPKFTDELDQQGVSSKILPAELDEKVLLNTVRDVLQSEDGSDKSLLWIERSGPRFQTGEELAIATEDFAPQVTACDEELGRLLAIIDDTPQERPLIIVTAAEGEIILACSENEEEPPPLHEEVAHCPLIVHLPGSEQAGSRRRELTQSIDIAPTLTAWFGVDASELAFDGISLISLVEGSLKEERKWAYVGDRENRSIIGGGFRLIQPSDSISQLYLKPEDRFEQADAAAEYPGQVEEMEAALDEFLSQQSVV